MLRGLTVGAIAVSVALAATAAASAAGWSKPRTLVRTGTPTYQPQAAIGRDGTAVLVWEEYKTKGNLFSIVAAVRRPSGATKIKMLGKASGPSVLPSLAVGGDGTVAVAWPQPGSKGKTYAAVRIWRPGAGFFGKTALMSGGNVSTKYGSGNFPQVAVDDVGTVYAVWEGSFTSGRGKHDQVVETQLPKGAHAWRSQVRLSPAGVDAYGARVAANGGGHAAVSWSQSGGAVQASVKPGNAAQFGLVQLLSGSSFAISPPSVGVSDSGKTAVVWDGGAGRRRVQSKVTKGLRFPHSGKNMSGLAEFQASALASNGSGAAAWLAEVGGGWSVQAKVLSASSTGWSKKASRLTPAGYVAMFGVAPAIAVDNRRAVVAWRQRDMHKADSVGVTFRAAGHGWQPAKVYPAVGTAVAVGVPADPAHSGRVLGVLVWTSIKGLEFSILG